jgi:hypothetical protein
MCVLNLISQYHNVKFRNVLSFLRWGVVSPPPNPQAGGPLLRLRAFENRVFRRIFGPKRDEVTGGWRKLNNEELHGLYFSPSIVRVTKAREMRWAGHVARMGEVRGACNILVWKPEGRRLLGRPKRRWEDNITMDLREIGFWDVD